MTDAWFARKEDIRKWCNMVGAKRVYQSNVSMRVMLRRLERFEAETGIAYPGKGNWNPPEGSA